MVQGSGSPTRPGRHSGLPLNAAQVAGLRVRLLRWFDRHKRSMPWRGTRDPYRIWVSEVMLQQTRVAAVLEHYSEFLRRFPTVQVLAAASLDEVLAAWSGLGYYRRARMMHAAAREIVADLHGAFPKNSERWRTLPGIGRYTAAAIASIAFDEPCAVVDGNVERVLLRLRGVQSLSPAELWESAQRLIHPRRPGDFNQAMMELGATVCTPKSPTCAACPLTHVCLTRGEHGQSPQPARKRRELAFCIATTEKKIKLVRRADDETLMAGMWELPSPESAGGEPLFSVRHSITDTDYLVRVFSGERARRLSGRWVDRAKLPTLALTGLARKILRRSGII